ncbi:YbaB/EbfC family nucleoid-associated protein [Ammonifex thiophilus]|uniref:YbaB/EbfC family nucleoid-associated protein n=1 Tax=Ammonifex thiophilus TaxID=444093 RepID=UPI0014028C51|nr:YbaB/EbfC family nucleoid-associated protein [Ammonifex thiophilus]
MWELSGLGELLNKVGKIAEALKELRVEVQGRWVTLVFNGMQEVLRIRLAPEGCKDIGRLEADLARAFNQGIILSRQAAKKKIEEITGWSIPEIPGLL